MRSTDEQLCTEAVFTTRSTIRNVGIQAAYFDRYSTVLDLSNR